MRIDEILTYDDLDLYIKKHDFKNLSDEDINKLCLVIMTIKENRIKQIESKKLNSNIKALLIMLENSVASRRIFELQNCTEARRIANMERVQESLEKLRVKEAYAYGIQKVLD